MGGGEVGGDWEAGHAVVGCGIGEGDGERRGERERDGWSLERLKGWRRSSKTGDGSGERDGFCCGFKTWKIFLLMAVGRWVLGRRNGRSLTFAAELCFQVAKDGRLGRQQVQL